ncbi:MAG: hypothetical protein PHT51_03040 [Patescibacteria group bacterium]|nr:hypothetical protein [Patescibacteria group bacterium]MDD4611166.1 hypothetical protein [Patescibacteria group bacterium]
MKKIKALVLLSGGLDSMLAVKILQAQGIDVTAVAFESNFFNANKAREAVEELKVPLEVINISKELLEIVKNPKCGHGKCLNPCIDCHAFMIKKASVLTSPPTPLLIRRGVTSDSESGRGRREGAGEVIATGEVLGQRPMSQNKQSLGRVEKLAGVEVLRPLSAKLLPETIYEKIGLINRKKLLDIEGRGRERQMKLAKKFGIKKYPAPAGGCLLTEAQFCDKLREMIKNWPECGPKDVELLKYGRPFWAKMDKKYILIIVGRDKRDNEALEKLAKKGDIVVELKNEVGPLTVVRIFNFQFSTLPTACLSGRQGRQVLNELSNFKLQIPKELNIENLKLSENKSEEEILKSACLLAGYHAPKARGREVNFQLKTLPTGRQVIN